MNLLTLIGSIDDNFYQLGLLDKEEAKNIYHHLLPNIKTPWGPVNQGILELIKIVLKNSIIKYPGSYPHLISYSEGLGMKLEDVMLNMHILEIVNPRFLWAPNILKNNLGSSSFFSKNDKAEIIHGHNLNFFEFNNFNLKERTILYDLKGMPKTMGFNFLGNPYPGLTLMTENGMSLSAHQSFSPVFNKHGIFIFELIFDLIKNAHDKKSVLDYLKFHHSITAWELNICFNNGDAMAIDLLGENINVKNIITPELKQQSEVDLLYQMTMSKPQNISSSNQQSIVMNPKALKAFYLEGDAPKIYRQNIMSINNIFTHPSIEKVKPSLLKNNFISHSGDYYVGMKSLIEAQKGFQSFDSQKIYHHLQMAIDHFESFPEKTIARFYFLVAQYLFETHSKILIHLLHDFKTIEKHLPLSLLHHCKLFIYRLERILKVEKTDDQTKDFNSDLLSLINKEVKIPDSLLHSATKKMTAPRLDLLDIFYLYHIPKK